MSALPTLVNLSISDQKAMSSLVKLLPPLNVSQINDLPEWESSAQYGKRTKIGIVLRHLYRPKLIEEGSIKNWSVQVYTDEELKTKPTLPMLFSSDDQSDDSDDDGCFTQKTCEYLIFLFQKAYGESSPVFVLSTSKAYKWIRKDCSMQFPRHFSRYFSGYSGRIQQVSTRQIFGQTGEISASLRQSVSETVSHSDLVCHEFTVITDQRIKIQFKENGILIYKKFSLENYVNLIEDFISKENGIPIFEWEIPGLPQGNLLSVTPKMQRQLNCEACRWLVGLKSEGWTFNFRFSETRSYSNAINFRLYYERRRYGFNAQRAIDSWPAEFPFGPALPDLEDFRGFLLANSVFPINHEDATDSMRELAFGPVFDRQVSFEYQTINGHWYGNYLIDCIEGWVRTNQGDVYFKNGSLWYQIHKDYVKLVREALQRVVSKEGCLLTPGEQGYLNISWDSGGETEYNRSYLILNALHPTPPSWIDGNQKFRSKVELFDILHIAESNQVFIYHVKKSFGVHIREAVSQLIISAQVIYNTRNASSFGLDSLLTQDYCQRVSPYQNEAGNNRLFQALKTGTLHFVLAFRSDGYQSILDSGSLIAQQEVIRAQEELTKLGFSFKISPIPSSF